MPKTYALDIENIGEDTYTLMSRGHHDIHDFMREVRLAGYEWPLGVPTHVWMKTRPSRDTRYECFYDVVPARTRGAWPATQVLESYGDERYEARYPVQASLGHRLDDHAPALGLGGDA